MITKANSIPLRLKARCVTLLEVVLVMALLAIVGSVGGYLSYSASKKEEFNAACTATLERLRFAEELMMLGVDIDVRFRFIRNKLHVLLIPDRILDETTARLLSIRSPIEGIAAVEFNHLPLDQIRLRYTSFGMEMPKGELILKGKFGEKTITLKEIQQPFNTTEVYPHEILQKAT
jgi:hypothetical protein